MDSCDEAYSPWNMEISVPPISLELPDLLQKYRDCFVAENLAPRNDNATKKGIQPRFYDVDNLPPYAIIQRIILTLKEPNFGTYF